MAKRSKKGLKARQEFLRALMRHCGGVTAVSRYLGKSKQLAENWIQRGEVPLVLCRRLAVKFQQDEAAFNFVDTCKYHGIPQSWETIVKTSPLTSWEQGKVLQYEAPELPEDTVWF